tara:strand:- start:588 stop:1172 length:585 start_codon:yes stop_codon:yes gene_type:complete
MSKKNLIVFMLLITTFLQAQEKNIKTQSVVIDDLISFVIENYKTKQKTEQTKNIIFLVQFNNDLSQEQKIILKQSLKLISSRLTEDDKISILTYSGVNGVVLKQTNPTKIKKVLSSIIDFNQSIKEIHKDGIGFAYKYANDNFDEDAINSIIMVRNSNPSAISSNQKQTKKKNNNLILLTAISLLPEMLSVIKN